MVLGRAVENNKYFLLHAMVDSMMWNIPAGLVYVVERDLFTEIVFNHIGHECDVFALVLVVSIHLSLEILESQLRH